jgi:hypothetical protein
LFKSLDSAVYDILKHDKMFRKVLMYLILGIYKEKEGMQKLQINH